MVVYYRRPGGQLQHSSLLDLEPESDRIRKALIYIREHLTEALPIEPPQARGPVARTNRGPH